MGLTWSNQKIKHSIGVISTVGIPYLVKWGKPYFTRKSCLYFKSYGTYLLGMSKFLGICSSIFWIWSTTIRGPLSVSYSFLLMDLAFLNLFLLSSGNRDLFPLNLDRSAALHVLSQSSSFSLKNSILWRMKPWRLNGCDTSCQVTSCHFRSVSMWFWSQFLAVIFDDRLWFSSKECTYLWLHM